MSQDETPLHSTTNDTPDPAARKDGEKAACDGRPQLWSAAFLIIVGMSFFLFVTGQSINGGLAVYVERIGGTSTFAGMLSLVFSFAAGVARILLGPVIDRKGRIIVAFAGSLVLLAGIALAGLVTNNIALTIARIIQGIGFAAATTAAATAAADVLPAARMGEGIGYFGLGQAVAMSFGPAMALAVLATDPPENLFLLSGAVAAIACVLTLTCRYERRPETLPKNAVYRLRAESEQRESQSADEDVDQAPRGISAFFEPRALCGTIPLALMCGAVGFAISFVGLYGEKIGVGNAGLFFTLSAITMIIVRARSNAFMDAAMPITIFGATTVCGLVGFLLLLAAPAFPALIYIAGLFYGVFLGLGGPVNQAVAVKNTPPQRWGAANALVLLANDIGIGTASLIWGFVNDAIGFSASIVGCIICIIAAYALAWAVYPAEAKQKPR